MKLIPCLCLLAVWLPLAGCTENRNLKVTEVWTNRVELFLDEPADQVLPLRDKKLKWSTQVPGAQPVIGELDLGIVGSIRGQQFLVIYEDVNHTGPPLVEDFRPMTVPGIKVRNSFLPGYGSDTRVSMGVEGEHVGTYILFIPAKAIVKDLVRFGPRPRPPLPGSFGAFNETGALDSLRPNGGLSISRRFSGSTPVDTDSEGDWSRQANSIGVANPP